LVLLVACSPPPDTLEGIGLPIAVPPPRYGFEFDRQPSEDYWSYESTQDPPEESGKESIRRITAFYVEATPKLGWELDTQTVGYSPIVPDHYYGRTDWTREATELAVIVSETTDSGVLRLELTRCLDEC
jgi:hypothetical protein